MRMVAPEGPVYQAGTLSGNPVAMAAGLATISLMERGGSYRRLDSTSARLERGLREEADTGRGRGDDEQGGLDAGGVLLRAGRSRTSRRRRRTDRALYAKFHRSMLDEGIYLPPSAFETHLRLHRPHRGRRGRDHQREQEGLREVRGKEVVMMNSTFLDACNRKEPAHTPVWFMRQAGRYLPSYRAVKGEQVRSPR